MASINPFRDEHPADAELPTPESNANLNPYASPRATDGIVRPATEPVGAWRDGGMLVVHRNYERFPDVCVLTAEPSERRYAFRVQWTYPIDVYYRYLNFDVGVCEPCYRRRRRIRFIGYSVMVLMALVAVAIARSGLGFGSEEFSLLVFLATAGVMLAAFYLATRSLVSWKFRRKQGEYYWLTGVDLSFLATLPDWKTRQQ